MKLGELRAKKHITFCREVHEHTQQANPIRKAVPTQRRAITRTLHTAVRTKHVNSPSRASATLAVFDRSLFVCVQIENVVCLESERKKKELRTANEQLRNFFFLSCLRDGRLLFNPIACSDTAKPFAVSVCVPLRNAEEEKKKKADAPTTT